VSSDPQVIPDFNDAWKTALAKAKKLIAGFSIEEKVRVFATVPGSAYG
jgi:beta-glucosidase